MKKLGDLITEEDFHMVYDGPPTHSFIGDKPKDGNLCKLYDGIVYKLCSARLANEYNRGYNDSLMWVLDQIRVITDGVAEIERKPVIGDKYICDDAEQLSTDDSFYNGEFVTGNTYTIVSINDVSDNIVIVFDEAEVGIYINDLKNWFSRSVDE